MATMITRMRLNVMLHVHCLSCNTLVGIIFFPEVILIDFYWNRFTSSNMWIKCLHHPSFGWYQMIPQLNYQKPKFGGRPKVFNAIPLLLHIEPYKHGVI